VKRHSGALLPPPSAAARSFCCGELRACVPGRYDLDRNRFGGGEACHSEADSTSESHGGDVASVFFKQWNRAEWALYSVQTTAQHPSASPVIVWRGGYRTAASQGALEREIALHGGERRLITRQHAPLAPSALQRTPRSALITTHLHYKRGKQIGYEKEPFTI